MEYDHIINQIINILREEKLSTRDIKAVLRYLRVKLEEQSHL